MLDFVTTNSRGRAITAARVGVFLLLFFCFFIKSAMAGELTISGKIFEDLNFNQAYDFGESKLSGWTINLYQNKQLIKSVLSDIDGNYDFSEIKAGEYELKADLSDGWIAVLPGIINLNLSQKNIENANFANYQIIRPEKNSGPIILTHTFQTKILSPNSAKISWHTSHNVVSQVVFDYSSKPVESLSLSKNSLNYSFLSYINLKATTYHEIILDRLKPGTTYYFRMISLPDPRQWRGANRLISNEFSFITPNIIPGVDSITTPIDDGQKNEKPNIQPKPNIKPAEIILPNKKEGFNPRISVHIISSEKKLAVDEGKTKTEQIPIDENQSKSTAIPSKNCYILIFFPLILNIIIVIIIRSFGKRTNKYFTKKLWLICLILFLVPSVLNYPQCQLINWLIITFFINLAILSGFKKKKTKVEKITTNISDQIVNSVR